MPDEEFSQSMVLIEITGDDGAYIRTSVQGDHIDHMIEALRAAADDLELTVPTFERVH